MKKTSIFTALLLSSSILSLSAYTTFAQDKPVNQVEPEQTPDIDNTPAAVEAKIKTAIDLPPETVLADVNGQTVKLEELRAILDLLPDEYKAIDEQVLINTMLRQFIDETLIVNAAQDEKFLEKPEIKLLLESIQRDSIAEIYLDRKVTEKVTDEYLQTRYNTVKQGYTPVEEINASHILVEDEATIKKVISKLEAGTPFEELAQEYGQDGTSDNGGDLGWFVKEDMVEPFSDAAFKLEKGKISAPVKTAFGWHVIRLDDRRERAFPSFEELKPQLESEAKSKELRQIVENLRATADIKIKSGFDIVPGDQADVQEKESTEPEEHNSNHNHGKEESGKMPASGTVETDKDVPNE